MKLDLIQQTIIQSALANKSIYSEVAYEFNQDYWFSLASDYVSLMNLIKQTELTDEQKQSGLSIIQKYPDKFSSISQLINDKPIKRVQPAPTNNVTERITIDVFEPDGKTKIPNHCQEYLNDGLPHGLATYYGNYILIKSPGKIICPDGLEVARPDSNSLRIKANKHGKHVIKCGNTEITIEIKLKRQ